MKIKKKKFFWGGGVVSGGGGGGGGVSGSDCQSGCEQKIEVFVKIQKKKKIFFGGGGGGSGGQWEGSGWGVRVDVNKELKFL